MDAYTQNGKMSILLSMLLCCWIVIVVGHMG